MRLRLMQWIAVAGGGRGRIGSRGMSMDPSPPRRRPWALRYGLAVVAIGVVLGLKLLLVPWVMRDAPFLLFSIAVMGSAFYGGLGPGLLATILAALASNVFFMSPFYRLELNDAPQRLRVMLFLVEGGFVSWLCASLIRSRTAAQTSEREARDLEAKMLDLAESQERRLGHDLHDGLGQHLTGIAMMGRRLEKHLAARGAVEASEATEILRLVNGAVGWTHDLARSLSPPALDREGLTAALRELCGNAKAVFQVKCELHGADRPVFTELSAGVHVYRIVQEAIHNAVRHGKATAISVRLECRDGGERVEVSDDGAGFDPAGVVGGMGLRIMRYRAKMIDAAIEVRSVPGSGATLACVRKNRGN